jgi:RNA polymerase sigma-70 factor (ECF subfamily)
MTRPPTLAGAPDDARAVRFTAVAAEVWDPLQRYLRRRAAADDVDDVAAETLTVLWRRLDQVPAGTELPWCYATARRCLANHRRGTVRRRRLVDRVTGRRETRLHEPDAAAAVDELDPDLHRALAQLSADDRELLQLWAWEQLSVSELAVALETSPNTISVRLRRARQRLAAAIPTDAVGQDPVMGCHIGEGAGHEVDGRTQETPR